MYPTFAARVCLLEYNQGLRNASSYFSSTPNKTHVVSDEWKVSHSYISHFYSNKITENLFMIGKHGKL